MLLLSIKFNKILIYKTTGILWFEIHSDLNFNYEHDKDELDNKLTELNGLINPIMSKLYNNDSQSSGIPENIPSGDEID